MTVTSIVGAHWGDEGKGKIADLLAEKYDIVARWNGGNNAGHTVMTDDGKAIAFHNIPSGMRHKEVINVIGNGEVVNLESLLDEINGIRSNGIEVTPNRLILSDNAHLILPYYLEIERKNEAVRGIGTTGRGIGPTYTFKPERTGVRVVDLLDSGKNFTQSVATHAEKYGLELDQEGLLESQRDLLKQLKEYISIEDTVEFFRKKHGADILLEGAQGVLLGVDSGTYPYVTSSDPSPGGAYSGCLGIPPIDNVILVMKAGYVTRVGNGPFPTEMGTEKDIKGVQKGEEIFTADDMRKALQGDPVSLAKYHRVKGGEYGTTTGRPRRVGYQDLVATMYSRDVSNVAKGIGSMSIVLTKLDVSDRNPALKVCVRYNQNGTDSERFPRSVQLNDVKPVYEQLECWNEDTRGLTKYGDLPRAARNFIRYIEDQLKISVSLISTGPKRNEIIDRKDRIYF